MPDPVLEAAWSRCEFCSKPNKEVFNMIRDVDKWRYIPFESKCAWKRISQVAFRNQYQFDVGWKDLCRERSYQNNLPANSYDETSTWMEGYCHHYADARKKNSH